MLLRKNSCALLRVNSFHCAPLRTIPGIVRRRANRCGKAVYNAVAMNDVETQQRFVFLRAEGWSFARIAEELKVSKPTLINWSRQFQFEIRNQRAINIEALQEKWLSARDVRVNALGEQLRKVEAELAKRDLATVSTARLFALVETLRRQIQRETGPMEFSVSTEGMPLKEFYAEVRQWNP